jgi:hypothetical protein
MQEQGYEASLEVGELYRVLPDEQAEGHGYLRIVDESGEDYGYAAERFFSIEAIAEGTPESGVVNRSPNKPLERPGMAAVGAIGRAGAGRSAPSRSATEEPND